MDTQQLGSSKEQISNLALGTMYFGSRVNKKDSFALLDQYQDPGGSNIDTANNYCFWLDGFHGGESESLIGEWFQARKNRDKIFLATKCGVNPLPDNPDSFEGLSKKAVLDAAEQSLKRLQTDYIDLYYMHADWREVPIEETLEAMNILVESGKVRNIACSNMLTWRIVKARSISDQQGWAKFHAVQNWFSYLKPRENADLWIQRFVNDELIDYCQTEGDLTVFAYTSTLGGMYSWDSIYDRHHPALHDRFFSEDNERRFRLVQELSKKYGVSVFQIVFAWMRQNYPFVIPIMGV
jgi:aryl-alcohol dehydrogenase-like predicted oxidoreductase